MPMIVMHRRMPAVRWPRASSQPTSTIQMMLPITEPIPKSRRTWTDRPNGQSTYDALRKAAMPNGIVMIKIKQTIPARKYRIAIHQPHKISQIRLRISLMLHLLPVTSQPHPASPGLCGRAHLDRVQQPGRRGGDLGDGLVEGGGIAGGGRAEPADLPDVLQRGGLHVGVGHGLGVRGAQGLDRATHSRQPTCRTVTLTGGVESCGQETARQEA